MAFTADTRNHFLREAKREYTERRNTQIVHKWRTPLWRELTEQQREEWAQYMHDEWLKRPNPAGLRKPDLFGDVPYELTWFDESAPFTKAMFDKVLKQDISENEAVNRRVDELKADAILLNEELVRRFDVIGRRLDALEYEQPQKAAPMVMEVKLDTSEVQTAINDTLAEIEKVKIEVGYLRKQKKWLQDTHAEQFKLLQQRNTEIEDLKKECDARKQDEVKLRQSIEALAQDLHAERNKAKPYIIYGNNLGKLYQEFGEGWYEKHVSTHNLHIIYMTGAQYDRVKALADLFEV